MISSFTPNLGEIKLSPIHRPHFLAITKFSPNISLEIEEGAAGLVKMVIPAKPFQYGTMSKLLLVLLIMVLLIPVVRKPEFLRFTRWDYIAASSMMVFIAIWNLYEFINAFIESQTLLIKDNHLIIQKDRLFNSVEYFIPLEGIYAVQPRSYFFKFGKIWTPFIPTVFIGSFRIPFGEYISFSEAYWVSQHLDQIILNR